MTKITELFQHPDGGAICFDHSSGEIELHDHGHGSFKGFGIGPVGLLELAAACARLGAELLEGAA